MPFWGSLLHSALGFSTNPLHALSCWQLVIILCEDFAPRSRQQKHGAAQKCNHGRGSAVMVLYRRLFLLLVHLLNLLSVGRACCGQVRTPKSPQNVVLFPGEVSNLHSCMGIYLPLRDSRAKAVPIHFGTKSPLTHRVAQINFPKGLKIANTLKADSACLSHHTWLQTHHVILFFSYFCASHQVLYSQEKK